LNSHLISPTRATCSVQLIPPRFVPELKLDLC
jgi:hypothetical protein